MTRPMVFSVVNGRFVGQKEVIHWTFEQNIKKNIIKIQKRHTQKKQKKKKV